MCNLSFSFLSLLTLSAQHLYCFRLLNLILCRQLRRVIHLEVFFIIIVFEISRHFYSEEILLSDFKQNYRMQASRKKSKLLTLNANSTQIAKLKVSFQEGIYGNRKFNLNLADIKNNELDILARRVRSSTINQNQASEEKPHRKTYKFAETLKKVRKTTRFKNLWISKRGTRNFYIMQNQDFVLIDQKNKDYRLYAVLDGHGKYGKGIAEAAANRLAFKYLNEQKNLQKQNLQHNNERIMKTAISQTNKYLSQNMPKQSSNSGCTLISILIRDSSIFCFNIGNSRAVLATRAQESLLAFPLSSDQNLSRFDQKFRVLQTNAVIEQLKDQYGCRIGPERIWKKGQKYPGIFITRSLGMRLSSQLGVISDPESTCVKIRPNFQFILVCSDGFWQVFTNEEAIEYLSKFWLQEILEQGMQSMLDEAVRRWDKKSELMDDISILIIKL